MLGPGFIINSGWKSAERFPGNGRHRGRPAAQEVNARNLFTCQANTCLKLAQYWSHAMQSLATPAISFTSLTLCPPCLHVKVNVINLFTAKWMSTQDLPNCHASVDFPFPLPATCFTSFQSSIAAKFQRQFSHAKMRMGK